MMDAAGCVKSAAGHLDVDEGHSRTVLTSKGDRTVSITRNRDDGELVLKLSRESSDDNRVIVGEQRQRSRPIR
jgi:hypothetical protein